MILRDPGWRSSLTRVRQLARRLERQDPEPPVPPVLPPGRAVVVPGRGEIFLRDAAPTGHGVHPPILLLHGWTSSADVTWWRVYGRLAEVGRVLAVDHRGHGRGIRSDEPFTLEDAADDAAGLLRTLGCGPVVVCGYSMGGPIGMLLWQRHPDLVAGLVLQATALEWRASNRERLMWRAMGIVEWLLRSARSKGIIDRILRDVLERSPDAVEHRGWLEGELRRGDPAAIAEAGRALGRYDARPFAADVDVPVAVVVTTGDHLVPPRKQRALAAAVPGALQFDLAGDHDACMTAVHDFPEVTVRAVTAVSALAGSAR